MKIKLQKGEQELWDFFDSIEPAGSVSPDAVDDDPDEGLSESYIEMLLDMVQKDKGGSWAKKRSSRSAGTRRHRRLSARSK